ncbi:MAG: flavin reductase family protein [Thermoprotei archaeon]|nr:MAG: flavin reductase family protein [Thermoprotei archaeon]
MIAHRLLHPQMVVLVTSALPEEKYNVMTAAWCMPASFNPPLAVVSISPLRYTHEIISKTGEFVINIPGVELLDVVKYCGSVSGRNVDKFEKTGITPIRGKKVKAPIIKECIAALECIVERSVNAGDHTLFIGRIADYWTREGVFKDAYTMRFRPLLHLGGERYCTIQEI